ncbi:MAG: DUF1343 domain-containing protein [Cytophagales bacterium]|nr:MAG: DUF1343 domain-containing protein [Cytophagales bacterium]
MKIKNRHRFLFFILVLGITSQIVAQNLPIPSYGDLPQPVKPIVCGAEQYVHYNQFLKNKRVGLIVNQTSVLNKKSGLHLVDVLIAKNIKVVKIFSPEHGFRGNADAGEKVANDIDKKTGLPIISLYGANKKPSKEALKDIDVLVFDIQDVGARFYTYLSTMHYAMEACAENNKLFLLLDRPNPNGYYVAGPVLDLKFKSFVGMHPIPIVHGMTLGELALMINGEKWLDSNRQCKLEIVTVKNYHHNMKYKLPIKPSPNLPNAQSILLYPSLCLFEGTSISVGRGTNKPFQIIGAPDSSLGKFTFTPQSLSGSAKNPMYEGKLCYGQDLSQSKEKFTLKFLAECYNKSSDKAHFFNNFFVKLIGNETTAAQIKEGKSWKEIEQTWAKELNNFKVLRKKYLLYKDFKE